MANPTTPQFLEWLLNRLVNVYDESENTDFVTRLRAEAARAKTLRTNLSQNRETYFLAKVTRDEETGQGKYRLRARVSGKPVGPLLTLSRQQADDLSRQLDAPIDYFND